MPSGSRTISDQTCGSNRPATAQSSGWRLYWKTLAQRIRLRRDATGALPQVRTHGAATTRPAPASVCPKAINPGVAGAKPPSISFLFRINKRTSPRGLRVEYPLLLSWPCDVFCFSGGRALQHFTNKVQVVLHCPIAGVLPVPAQGMNHIGGHF